MLNAMKNPLVKKMIMNGTGAIVRSVFPEAKTTFNFFDNGAIGFNCKTNNGEFKHLLAEESEEQLLDVLQTIARGLAKKAGK